MSDNSQLPDNRTSVSQYDGNCNVLDVAGCLAFYIKNTGNVLAYLFGGLPIEPKEYLEFESPNGRPFANDVNVEFTNGNPNDLVIKQVTVIKIRPVSTDEERGLL